MGDQHFMPRFNRQCETWPPIHRRESKAGLRSLFTRSRSVLGDRTSTNKTLLGEFSEQRSNSTIGRHRQSVSGTPSRSLGSGATTSPTSSVRHSPPSSSRKSKSRVLTSWDPPPLFQAYPQSIVCATLETSCSSTNSIFKSDNHVVGRKNSASEHIVGDWYGTSNTVNDDEARLYVDPKKHKRTLSASISSNGWTKKLFLLITSGYLLQYSAEGHHDRLPEKILPLGKDSVAFASDAIPGRHWVLQVSEQAEHEGEVRTRSRKSSWSKFAFRSAESRRMARDILLVFDSLEEFDFWMGAVRKEIEGFGGLQYCDPSPTHELPQKPALEHQISKRVQIRKDHYQFSSPPDRPTQEREGPHQTEAIHGGTHEKRDDRVLQAEGLRKRSIGDSSILTLTELDTLRNSDTSSISTTTAPRTSCDECTCTILCEIDTNLTSESACAVMTEAGQPLVVLQVPPIGFPRATETSVPPRLTLDLDRRRSMDSYQQRSSALRISSVIRTRRERPTSLMPNFSLPIPGNRLSQGRTVDSDLLLNGPEEEMPQSGTGTTPVAYNALNSQDVQQVKNRPVSTLAPLPAIGMKKPCYIGRRSSDKVPIPPPVVTDDVERSDPPPSPRRVSAILSCPSSTNPSYVLFPKRYSSLERPQGRLTAPSPPPQCDLPELPKDIPSRHFPAIAERVAPSPRISSARGIRRPVSMQIRTEALKQCHTLGERSPAVTDAHFATCFGTEVPFMRVGQEQASNRAIRLTRSTSDTTIFTASSTSLRTSAVPPPRRKPSSRKSAPVLIHNTITKLPPLGPPPNCPLPAVPVKAKRAPRSRDIFEYQS